MFTGLTKEGITKHWDLLETLIDKPLKRMKINHLYDTSDVLFKCLERDWQCWVDDENNIKTVVITFIEVFPTGYKRLNVHLVGGQDIAPHFPIAYNLLKAFAKANGCKAIAGGGRKAWPKLIKQIDTNPVSTEIRFSVEI